MIEKISRLLPEQYVTPLIIIIGIMVFVLGILDINGTHSHGSEAVTPPGHHHHE